MKLSINIERWLKVLATCALALATIHCTLKKPTTEISVFHGPSDMVPKTFFVDPNTPLSGASKDRLVGKTFLCGWAPENNTGEFSDGFVYYQMAGHCNIQFEVTERSLIGRLINTSYPKSHDRWKEVFTIPIVKHFYWEKARDERGREMDTFVESERSDWSARPYMRLDFAGMQITDANMQFFDVAPGTSALFTSVAPPHASDVEWDFERGWLGFNLHAAHPYYGADFQKNVRVNFLRFEHNEDFKPTPYDNSNSKHINVLHVLGAKINGVDPDLYAGKWDTSKVHEVHLVGFPKEYAPIAVEVIEEWNNLFEKIGHKRPFKPVVVASTPHAFDLRYTSITWVDDRNYSGNAPLGVGMAIADVRNGEIKWGNVTLWGGLLDWIVNHDMPMGESASSGQNAKPFVQLGLLSGQKAFPSTKPAIPAELTIVPDLDVLKTGLRQSFGVALDKIEKNVKDAPIKRPDGTVETPEAKTPEELAQRKEVLRTAIDGRSTVIDQIAADYQKVAGKLAQISQQTGRSSAIFNVEMVQSLINMPQLKDSYGQMPYVARAELKALAGAGNMGTREQILQALNKEIALQGSQGHAAFDMDMTASEFASGMSAAVGKAGIDKYQVIRVLVKDLILHEVGHMLGLGHNFKENILPEKGSVPEKYISGTFKAANGKEMAGLETRAKKNMTNYSSVMGYKNGKTDILTPYDELHPGPMDEQVMQYIYNGKVAMIPADSNGKVEDFSYADLPTGGKIREQATIKGKKYKLAYFPACNDITASLSMDPYCNRWDRGYNASTITDNYFADFKGNMVSQLIAFSNTVKGSNFEGMENRLWGRGLTNFARARLFYDYMRQKYAADLSALMAAGGDQSSKNLIEFSDACVAAKAGKKAEDFENKDLGRLLTRPDRAELVDLCLASAKTVHELESLMLLQGKDYTEIDYFDSYVSSGILGGDAVGDWGRIWGSWKSLARTPIKTTALLALTNPYPYVNFNGWLLPVMRYAREDGSYHISTFFPKEYTAAIASATEMNMTFGNTLLDKSTTIGRAILSMGYFIQNTMGSNDILSAYTPFIENIRNQTTYQYSLSVVEITKKDEEGKKVARKFSGTIHNMFDRGPENIPDIYIYTNDRVISMPTSRSLLLPVSSIRWATPTSGYYFVIKLDYSDDFYDKLGTKSVRKNLESSYYELMKKCVRGVNNNGLKSFFNDSIDENIFPGFTFPDGIADLKSGDKNKFFVSVETYFNKYYLENTGKFNPKPDPANCEQALRGEGLLVMTASVLNGLYFQNLLDFIEKGHAW